MQAVAPSARPSYAECRAKAAADGSRIAEIREDGTLVLIRPDRSVGAVPGALYVTWNNTAFNYRHFAPAREEGSN